MGKQEIEDDIIDRIAQLNKIEFSLKINESNYSLNYSLICLPLSLAIMSLTHSTIIFNANKIMSDQDLLQRHMWKSKPCHFGSDCTRELEECAGAHFLEELRISPCLFLHICRKENCSMYHPNMGTAADYFAYMGFDKILPTQKVWQQRRFVIQGAKITLSNPELLRKHLFKSRPCFNGDKCKNKEECVGAHFLDEYRLPICLYLEFCQEKKCNAFHPHSGKTKEQFMEENNIVLPIRPASVIPTPAHSLSVHINPLVGANSKAEPPKTIIHEKKNTVLCSFVKENSKCKKVDCGFAHSVEDLVLPFQVDQGISVEKKREIVERLIKKTVPDFFLRPSYMNSVHMMESKRQIDMIDDMRREEMVDEIGDLLTDEDEKNIAEFLDEQEQERAMEEFAEEAELIELQIDTFYPSDNEQELELKYDVEEEEEEDDDHEDDDHEEYDLKVSIKIHNLSELEMWEKSKLEKNEQIWGDINDE